MVATCAKQFYAWMVLAVANHHRLSRYLCQLSTFSFLLGSIKVVLTLAVACGAPTLRLCDCAGHALWR